MVIPIHTMRHNRLKRLTTSDWCEIEVLNKKLYGHYRSGLCCSKIEMSKSEIWNLTIRKYQSLKKRIVYDIDRIKGEDLCEFCSDVDIPTCSFCSKYAQEYNKRNKTKSGYNHHEDCVIDTLVQSVIKHYENECTNVPTSFIDLYNSSKSYDKIKHKIIYDQYLYELKNERLYCIVRNSSPFNTSDCQFC